MILNLGSSVEIDNAGRALQKRRRVILTAAMVLNLILLIVVISGIIGNFLTLSVAALCFLLLLNSLASPSFQWFFGQEIIINGLDGGDLSPRGFVARAPVWQAVLFRVAIGYSLILCALGVLSFGGFIEIDGVIPNLRPALILGIFFVLIFLTEVSTLMAGSNRFIVVFGEQRFLIKRWGAAISIAGDYRVELRDGAVLKVTGEPLSVATRRSFLGTRPMKNPIMIPLEGYQYTMDEWVRALTEVAGSDLGSRP